MKNIIALLLFASFAASANGDTLKENCYHSMKYTIAVQIAGNSLSSASKKDNYHSAYEEGKWLGVDASGTDRMIKMTSGSPDSIKFVKNYERDESFASSFRNSFISQCHIKPDEYIIR